MTLTEYNLLNKVQQMRVFFNAEKVNLVLKDNVLYEHRRIQDFYIVMITDGDWLEMIALHHIAGLSS